MKKIAIILVNWNGKNDTLECLHSLKKVDYPCFEIFVVDNGSSDDSVSVIRQEFPNVHLIETHENLGFAGGNNVALKVALEKNFDYFFLLNNDTIVDPQILSSFVSAAEKTPKAGILGGKSFRYYDPLIIDHLGGKWDPKQCEFFSLHSNQTDSSDLSMEQVDYVCGCAFFIKKEVLETIGFLEPKFFLFWEESDYCYKAQTKGFEIWTVPDAKLWHKISASFVEKKPHSYYFWWRNRLLFIERNFPFSQKVRFYIKTLIPEIFHVYKLWIIKSLQLKFFSSSDRQNLQKKQKKYFAGCLGIWHYIKRKFGNAPLSFFSKILNS